jgi:hypothetical protein
MRAAVGGAVCMGTTPNEMDTGMHSANSAAQEKRMLDVLAGTGLPYFCYGGENIFP